jgi:sulfatase modifying factor 1
MITQILSFNSLRWRDSFSILAISAIIQGCSPATRHSQKVFEKDKMIYLQGGTYKGSDPQTKEPKALTVKSFYLDKNLVTVAEFDDFVKKTGYKTEAERFGNSAVFDFDIQNWEMKGGAYYWYPFGKDKEKAKPNHPVTQVSWNDAVAFAKWKGKRLPTDAEWEYAARNAGTTNDTYTWGNELVINGKYMANTWQGSFPTKNTVEDGYLTTSPVGIFGENKIGLTDMGGNVWQWTADSITPTGDDALMDPAKRKVTRGGSFLCDPNVCHGFKVTGRSSSTPETGMVHTGFRCAKDDDNPSPRIASK